MYGTTHERAEALAQKAAGLNLQPFHDKRVVRFEVRPHAWQEGTNLPTRWGVWPVWEYADRPDLGPQFGGPFLVLDHIA
jgi:hypothetical protein